MTSLKPLEAIDKQIEQAKDTIELGLAIERLRSNKDFKTVVINGYFEKEAIRLVHLKADPAMQSEASQLSIAKQMDAIGGFNQYLYSAMQMASMAEKNLASHEEEREEILFEGNE